MSQSRFPIFYLSFVVDPGIHSFIAITKQVDEQSLPTLIADFGLYGRDDN